MPFNDIVGQEILIQRLVSAYHEKRLSPVMLFEGHEGCGSLLLARAVAQFLLCDKVSFSLQPQNVVTPSGKLHDSCGQCASCLRFQQFAHPDMHYFFPVVSLGKTASSKEKRVSSDYMQEWNSFATLFPYGNLADWLLHTGEASKQANLSVLECEYISKVLRMKSYEGKAKVCIIWMPEMLGREANRLLKDIEEPTPETFILMVTNNRAAMLPTLVSRCLTAYVPQPKDKEVNLWLEQHSPELSIGEREAAALYAKGNLRTLHNMLGGKESSKEMEKPLIAMFDSIVRGGPAAQLSWVEEQHKQGKNYIISLLRSLQNYIAIYSSLRNRFSDGIDISSTYKQYYPTELFVAFQQMGMSSKASLISEVIEHSLLGVRSNSHSKLELHAMLIKCYTIFKQGRYMFSLFS